MERGGRMCPELSAANRAKGTCFPCASQTWTLDGRLTFQIEVSGTL